MADHDAINLVRAIVGAEITTEGIGAEDVLPRGSVVTISRDYGSGGAEVAKRLAARLGVKAFDREILDAVTKDARVDRYLMERLDEKVRSSLDDWAFTTITGKSAFKEDYRRHLVNVIVGIAGSGGVIVGRGAHLILDPARAFRVRVCGSVESCAERIAQRLGIPRQEAQSEVLRVNKERNDFVRSLFGVDTTDASRFDLVVNSDRLKIEQVVELILSAMVLAGFRVPQAVER